MIQIDSVIIYMFNCWHKGREGQVMKSIYSCTRGPTFDSPLPQYHFVYKNNCRYNNG